MFVSDTWLKQLWDFVCFNEVLALNYQLKEKSHPLFTNFDFSGVKILDLKGKVNKSDIRKAYKQKMKEYHPDKISNMAEELQELALKRTKEINFFYSASF